MTVTHAMRVRLAALSMLAVVLSGCASTTPTPTPAVSSTPRATAATPTTPGTSGTPGGGPSTGPGGGSPEPSGSPTGSPSGGPSTSPSTAPTPAATLPPIAGLEELTGTDGRLTVLLLGSDARAGLAGRRTDAIMVMTIDPTTGKVAAVSLPRDTESVPTGPGRTYRARVTGLYQSYLLRGSSEEKATQQTMDALAYAFGTEIDRYVFIGFEGVKKLVDAVGGVDVTLAKPLDDPFILVRPGVRGFHLKKGVNHLDGTTALLFARTRHADNDYERTRRQQQLLVAAAKTVIERGAENVPALLEVLATQVRTDIPLTSAPALFELIGRANLAAPRSAVLGPRKYSGPGSSRYAYAMKVSAVRALFDNWFAPVKSTP